MHPLFTTSDLYCNRHGGRPLTLYCLTDNKLLCDVCFTSDDAAAGSSCINDTSFSTSTGSGYGSYGGSGHTHHAVKSKHAVVSKCKKNLNLLQRKMQFYLDNLVAKKQVTREMIIASDARSLQIEHVNEDGPEAIQAKIMRFESII